MSGFKSAERARLALGDALQASPWKHIGAYVSERAWGTVREDYSPNGDAWAYLPHDQARSRTYRWSEDGLAGLCDLDQRMCFALAFWNGRDPFLKERLFGLSGPEGNHGEDVKEYWWYVDATPTASWLVWRYHYPQAEFPYAKLREENARRGKDAGEYELLDTGIFDADRYWEITAEYAKAAPHDICMRIVVRNAGPDAAELHVVPTLWFRNRWAFEAREPKPMVRADPEPSHDAAHIVAEEAALGRWRLHAGKDPAGRKPALLFCENETNTERVFGAAPTTAYPKDGINDHVLRGADTVSPAGFGTKAAYWYRLAVPAGATVELRLRLVGEADASAPPDLGAGFEATLAQRRREADEFYAEITPSTASADEAAVMRQALAGMIWSQQFYSFDVTRWLDGDPGQPLPPDSRKNGRNADWRHLHNHDVLAMPDKWEYPWYASWDLAFHAVVLSHVDPIAAKHQLLLMFREWYTHPNGQIPAYEWNFGDVNPPVQAWAALKVFVNEGGTDFDFLARVFHKLLINFTWWINRKDALGDNIFQGGFLGLDNVGPFDRSAPLPGGEVLQQTDGTAWMAKFCLNMLEMALRLAAQDRSYEDVALKFFEHFGAIAHALQRLWDEEDGFFYSRVRKPDGSSVPIRERSMIGLLPVFAAVQLDAGLWQQLPDFRKRARWFIDNRPDLAAFLRYFARDDRPELIALLDGRRLRRVLARMLDESEFLSPFGLRSLSRWHLEHPLRFTLDGSESVLDYEPAESRTGLFGGNSNWRGPVWFPLNFIATESLRHLGTCLGPDLMVELPTGSGHYSDLIGVAAELERRLVRLFLLDANGHRPAHGTARKFREDPRWRDHVLFYEYFHGDTGAGLGASHQTGWTGLVGAMLAYGRGLQGDGEDRAGA